MYKDGKSGEFVCRKKMLKNKLVKGRSQSFEAGMLSSVIWKENGKVTQTLLISTLWLWLLELSGVQSLQLDE